MITNLDGTYKSINSIDFDGIYESIKGDKERLLTYVNNNYKESKKKLSDLKQELESLDLESELGRKRKKEIEKEKANIVIEASKDVSWLIDQQMSDFIRLFELGVYRYNVSLHKAFSELEDIAIADNSKVDDIFFLLGLFKHCSQTTDKAELLIDYILKIIEEFKAVVIDERRRGND